MVDMQSGTSADIPKGNWAKIACQKIVSVNHLKMKEIPPSALMKYQYLLNNFPFLSISPDFCYLLRDVPKHSPEFSHWEKYKVEKGLKIKIIFFNNLILMETVSKLFHNWCEFMKELIFCSVRYEMCLYAIFLPKFEMDILDSSARLVFTGYMLSYI